MSENAPQLVSRPWYRLHVLTYVTVLAIGASLAIYLTIGQGFSPSLGFERIDWRHGWPLVFLCRKARFSQDGFHSRWPIDDAQVYYFRPVALAYDLLVSIVLLVLATLVVEFWCRRKSPLLRFTMPAAFVLAALTTMVRFAEYVHHGDFWFEYWDVLAAGPFRLGLLSVCLGAGFLVERFIVSPLRRRQFSLRGLFLAMAWLSVAFALYAAIWRRSIEHERTIETLANFGKVEHNGYAILGEPATIWDQPYGSPPVPLWRSIWVQAVLSPLVSLDASDSGLADDDLGQFAMVPGIQSLVLTNTRITDQGLSALANCGDLRELNLTRTKITDNGLVYLQALSHLHELQLDGTPITDKGLECVSKLNSLQRLSLLGTRVTPDGVHKLRQARPNLDVTWWEW